MMSPKVTIPGLLKKTVLFKKGYNLIAPVGDVVMIQIIL